ncbi:hypothetical protein [Facklamia sp. 7083-14-GEN3]|uniref:hypothetical protein n=1 Tax=Facklamia sp. 7083-14-GEN3 TaxID=2973478 RepID=UPI00215BDF5F|nr:hypothetical protein [Facklamia sp. 7083-14-GEN3]MCR8968463.1 hypothetical protein [Facklamia sp. 7083-14-GEN3]
MLDWPTYSYSDAANDMEKIDNNTLTKPILKGEFSILRQNLLKARDEIYEKYGFDRGIDKKYIFDLEFGLKFYEALLPYLDNRRSSIDDTWRYLSVKVIPDIVHGRFGLDENRFYKQSRRIYLKQIWWYIHLGWSENTEKTYNILKDNTTDTIQSIVERPGLGYNIPVYREILNQHSTYKNKDAHLLRRVMKLNTARVKLTSPELFPGGVQGYVSKLFSDVIE